MNYQDLLQGDVLIRIDKPQYVRVAANDFCSETGITLVANRRQQWTYWGGALVGYEVWRKGIQIWPKGSEASA